MTAALLAVTGADSQVVTILIVVASVLAGAGAILLIVRLVMSRRARAEVTPGEATPGEATAGEAEPGEVETGE